jgi:hypothetical protein
LSEEALEMARRLGDPETLAYALEGRLMATFWVENTEERIALASELIRLADDVGDLEAAAAARYYNMMFHLELGDMRAVQTGLEGYAGLAAELRQPAQLWLLVVTRATLAIFQGRFDEGKTLAAEALTQGQGAQRSDAVLSHRVQGFTLATLRGKLDGMEELLDASVREYPARPMFRCMRTWLYAALGRDDDARAELLDLAAHGFAALPRTNEWLFSLGFLADAAVQVRAMHEAEELYEQLLPYAERNACTADYIATGAVARPLGVLAATLGYRAAERHFVDALAMNERMGARPWLARTQEDYGHMLLSRGDRERGTELVEQTLSNYRELGMEGPLRKAEALAAAR